MTTWVGAKYGELIEFDADFPTLAAMGGEEFERHVSENYVNPVVAAWVREYTKSARQRLQIKQ